jgi:ubiquinol-cytochrome c reductase cytochrome c subunit
MRPLTATRRALVLAVVALACAAPAAADPPPPGVQTNVGESGAAGVHGRLAAQGYALYGANCATCHGSLGEGIAPAKHRGQGGITAGGPSLRGAGARAADFYLRTGYMPLRSPSTQPSRSRVLFTEHEIRALVAYVASLGEGPPIPKPRPERGSLGQGRKLFTEHCAGCHQVVAEGGFVTGARVPPLEDATATQIAEAVRIGPYVMPQFSKRAISDRELDSIVRYVQYAKHPDDRGGWSLGHLGPMPEGMVTWWIGAAVLVALCMLLGRRLKR